MRRAARTNPRWWAAVAGIALACGLIATACGSDGSDGARDSTESRSESYFGPPAGATEVAALGSADQVANLTFVDHGRRYLVHVGSVPMVRTSPDPTRSLTYTQRDGITVTATCGGSSQSSLRPGVVEVAGPLAVSWTEAGAVASVLSQDDTGLCSPTETRARRLVEFAYSLPRLDPEAWARLVAEHPIDVTGSPDSVSGSGRSR